ncbi:MAG: hypothetical protein WBA93_24055 [Microcoleaceae cyanobacterium]
MVSATTTRGFGSDEIHCIADPIDKMLSSEPTVNTIAKVREEISRLCCLHPHIDSIYEEDSAKFRYESPYQLQS